MSRATKKCAQMVSVCVILAAVFSLISPSVATSVMPPEYYIKGVVASEIKAIATVTDVKTISVGEFNSFKVATFRLEYALTKRTPEEFKGHCRSVETAEQKANLMMGGTLHFEPRVGARLFVTVSSDGGAITSMTPATLELERVVREEPERIEYRMSNVRIKNRDGSGSKEVMTPAEIEWRKRQMEKRKTRKPAADIDDYMKAVDRHGSKLDELQGQLLAALGDDDISETNFLLKSGADPNRPNAQGMTPLMYAESKKMAMLLVEHGAVPWATDKAGDTMLHHAVTRNRAPELIRYFIAQGVDPNQRGGNDSTPAAVAVMFFYETEGGNDIPDAESVFRTLVEGGADLNLQEASGQTLLMDAAMRDDRPMVELLLKMGADRNIRDVNGKTAKDLAREMGNMDLVQLLD